MSETKKTTEREKELNRKRVREYKERNRGRETDECRWCYKHKSMRPKSTFTLGYSACDAHFSTPKRQPCTIQPMDYPPAEKKQQKLSLKKIQAVSNKPKPPPKKQQIQKEELYSPPESDFEVFTEQKIKPPKPKLKESTIRKHREYTTTKPKPPPKPKNVLLYNPPAEEFESFKQRERKVDKRVFRLNWRRDHGIKSGPDPKELKDILSQM